MQRAPLMVARAGIVAVALLVPLLGSAQGVRPPGPPGTVLTMPTDDAVGQLRKVALTQVTPTGDLVGKTVEIDCPRTGCGTPIDLMVEGRNWHFFANLSFVGRGLYLSLEPRSIGIAAVMEFNAGHPGPTFVPFKGAKASTERAIGQIGFVIGRDASIRNEERNTDPDVMSSGPVYSLKREPDLILQIETSALIAAKTPPSAPPRR